MSNCRQLDFVVVGPTRAGTTWIYEYLLKHKDVCLPKGIKEINFFIRRYNEGLNWYFSHFQPLNGHKILGEVTATYFHLPLATKRIYKVNPDCKIICTLRSPVERSFSLYIHMKRYGYIGPKTTFREAFAERPVLIESSKYFTHVSRWLEYFGEKNVCVLLYDDLKKDPLGFIRTLCEFLGIEELTFPEELNKAVNAADFPINFTLARISHRFSTLMDDYGLYFVKNAGKKMGLNRVLLGGRGVQEELDGEDREYLYGLLRDEVEGLEELLGLSLPLWKVTVP